MDKRIFVMPKEGLLIRDEFTGQHIPAGGGWVKHTILVTKHLRVGDLSKANPPAAEVAADTAPRKRERMVTTGSEG